MILSSIIEPHKEIFNKILKRSIDILNEEAIKNPMQVKKLAGVNLEKFVTEIMIEQAIGTPFQNTIICDGGISFPDIIANKYYGVEVKTTIKNHWKTTGNSVLETTRKKDVERIYLLFGKLGDPIEFRYRPYEECLSEVVVTHSPRYLIDMNLAEGATIFNKIKIPYDQLRKSENPIRLLVNYYKSLLKDGEELWWIGPDSSENKGLVIKAWGNLSNTLKEEYRIKGFAYFPEILSKSQSKFNKYAIWLSTVQGIVCPNVRDVFTAGGMVDLVIEDKTYYNVPRIFKRIYENRKELKAFILSQSIEDLSTYWKVNIIESEKFSCWLMIAEIYSKEILIKSHYNLLRDIFNF